MEKAEILNPVQPIPEAIELQEITQQKVEKMERIFREVIDIAKVLSIFDEHKNNKKQELAKSFLEINKKHMFEQGEFECGCEHHYSKRFWIPRTEMTAL